MPNNIAVMCHCRKTAAKKVFKKVKDPLRRLTGAVNAGQLQALLIKLKYLTGAVYADQLQVLCMQSYAGVVNAD